MSGEHLGYEPTIEKPSGEVVQPYVEQKENFGRQHFDTTIAFGNGPVKPVLLPSELTDEQRAEWEDFKTDPIHKNEPFFRVIEGQAFMNELAAVDQMQLSPDERAEKVEEIRNRWQHTGRLALTRWARQTALAAGLTLYLGITDRVMLSGGRSGNEWAKEHLPASRHDAWPSEAELMKDIIVRRFGDLYQKKYGQPIEEGLEVEDQSINTLENLANTINHNPGDFTSDKKVSLLTADFHARRVAALTHLFGVLEAPRGQLSAQEMLRERAEIRGRKQYASDLAYFRDTLHNPDLRERLEGEERWEKGLVDENFLAYWLGYMGDVENPAIIQNVIEGLKDDSWAGNARAEFQRAGLNFDEFTDIDLTKLQTEDPAKYSQLLEGIGRLKGELRILPPPNTV